MKRLMVMMVAWFALMGMAQENQPLKLQFDQSTVSPLFTRPELPAIVVPASNVKPTFNVSVPSAAALQLDDKARFADSLAVYNSQWNSSPLSLPSFRYDTNPYARDWSSGGVITRLGGAFLTGAGSHTTYPGMGGMASASVAFTIPIDRLTVTAGVTGSKYHFDRDAWNDYGVFGNASFRLNDRFSVNAFAQYYVNQRFHSVAVMPFLSSSSYGGTLAWRASDNFSLDVGARRLYDPYTGRWHTLPVVQPTITLLGAPISFDAGPLIYRLLDGLFGKGRKNTDWGDPRFRPVAAPGAFTGQPGFNPNSPVPVPDVFRH